MCINNKAKFRTDIVIVHPTDFAPVSSVTSVVDNKWHLLVGKYDGSTVSVYVDGKFENSSNFNHGIGSNNSELIIGNDPDCPNRFFNGIIDDIRIYNRALSEEEIKVLYKKK